MSYFQRSLLPLLMLGALSHADFEALRFEQMGFASDPEMRQLPTDFETAPRTLAVDEADVWCMALSRDGRLVATSHDHHRVALRDAMIGSLQQLLTDHTDVVPFLAFSPDGTQLATFSYDTSIKLWDVKSRSARTPIGGARLSQDTREPGIPPTVVSLRATLRGHTNRVVSGGYSADGRQLASCGYDGTIRIWNTDTGQSIGTMAGTATVRSVAFFPSGDRLASAGVDGTARLWDIASLAEKTHFDGHSSAIRVIKISPDANTLATAGEDNHVKLRDAKTGKTIRELSGFSQAGAHDAMIWSMEFSPNGSVLATGDFQGEVKLWDADTGGHIQTLSGHTDAVTAIAFAAESEALFTSSFDRTIRIWRARLPSSPPLTMLDIQRGKAWSIAAAPDGKTLAVAGRKGFIELWDLQSGKLGHALAGHPATVDCLEFSLDGSLLATAGWRSQEIIVWNATTRDKQFSLKASDVVRSVAFSPDGTRLAAACNNKMLEIWSLADGTQQISKRAHSLPVYDVEYSADGTLLATCSGDWKQPTPGIVKLWNVRTMKDIATLKGHKHAVRALAFDANGKRLASAGEDGMLKIWDVESAVELTTYQNSAAIRTLAFSHDASRVAAGLQDGKINIWDVQRGKVDRRLRGPADIFSLRFSRDDSVIISANGGKQIGIWQLSPTGSADTAQRIGRWSNSQAPTEK